MCLFYGKHKLNHSYYFFSCKYALPAQNACSLTENHRDFRSNKKRHLKARLLSVSFYGAVRSISELEIVSVLFPEMLKVSTSLRPLSPSSYT